MIGPLHHVGIAVRRLEDAIPRFEALGLSKESVEEVRTEGVRVAFLGSGGAGIELLEPLGEDTPVGRFLERRGEGLHHVAFSTEDIVGDMRRLGAQGFELIDREPRPGAHGRKVAFIHPRSAGGVLLELVQEGSQSR